MPAQLARVLVSSIVNHETTRLVLIASYGDGHGDLVYIRGPHASIGGARLMARAAEQLVERVIGEAVTEMMGEMMTTMRDAAHAAYASTPGPCQACLDSEDDAPSESEESEDE